VVKDSGTGETQEPGFIMSFSTARTGWGGVGDEPSTVKEGLMYIATESYIAEN
jgi:hypothetical protein